MFTFPNARAWHWIFFKITTLYITCSYFLMNCLHELWFPRWEFKQIYFALPKFLVTKIHWNVVPSMLIVYGGTYLETKFICFVARYIQVCIHW